MAIKVSVAKAHEEKINAKLRELNLLLEDAARDGLDVGIDRSAVRTINQARVQLEADYKINLYDLEE